MKNPKIVTTNLSLISAHNSFIHSLTVLSHTVHHRVKEVQSIVSVNLSLFASTFSLILLSFIYFQWVYSGGGAIKYENGFINITVSSSSFTNCRSYTPSVYADGMWRSYFYSVHL